ncbi:hypothetical protein E2F43_01510 [Seongchinamella unica]|jgi:hypothetical protein|uniref:Uncharacterized protein n=1 Tax=Seongchinamella unica TaxID=2547392 RepID=A0A4R5LU93_9GAMM|nr:hypothetical protein [Seongchinamella unica]TDG14949.1 hypothetical protein E2F43_01510 [Seongchinamella unica]
MVNNTRSTIFAYFLTAPVAMFVTGLFSSGVLQASEQADWKACSQRLADSATASLTGGERRACVIAVAGTYLQWVRGDLAAAQLPLADDFKRRSLGTLRGDATTGRTEFLQDSRSDLIESATEQEWAVDGDTAWAIFTVKLKASPEETHWVAERFIVTNGRISDILALPPVVKP